MKNPNNFASMFILCVTNIKLSLSKIELSADYDKYTHPLNTGENHLDIHFSFDLAEIREIDEVKGTMIIKYSFTRIWRDDRIKFSDLKDGQCRILPEEKDKIWLPWTIFDNFKHKNTVYKSDKPHVYLAKQTFNGSSTNESDIMIVYRKETIAEFMCDYDMFWFPFDSQSCNIQLYQKEDHVNLLPDDLIYRGPKMLEQYTVTGIKMCHSTFEVRPRFGIFEAVFQGLQPGLEVVFELSRPLTSSLLTTFLPTTILVIITHLANAFATDYQPVVIQVNLTVLLVLATL